jgi:hypothetical protein
MYNNLKLEFYHLDEYIMVQRYTQKREITIYRTYFEKITLYETETWTCTTRQECKLQSAEIKFLKKVGKNQERENYKHIY